MLRGPLEAAARQHQLAPAPPCTHRALLRVDLAAAFSAIIPVPLAQPLPRAGNWNQDLREHAFLAGAIVIVAGQAQPLATFFTPSRLKLRYVMEHACSGR